MRYSSFCQRITGDGAAAWDTHMQAAIDYKNGADVIVMSVGDPDMDTPVAVVNAAVAALRGGDTHYEEVNGKAALRSAIAHRHQERTGQVTGADDVMVFSGGQNALFASLLCVLEAGDEAIILEPAYVTYEASIQATGATLVRVSQTAESGFRPDIQALVQAITPATRLILLTSPNNPTGVVLNQSEIKAIAELAIKHDLWVITDDVYSELVFEGEYCAMASIPAMTERLVSLGSLSKSHAMTGWRTGWAIAPPALIGHFYNTALTMLYGLPGFIQAGGICALTDAWDKRLQMREIYAGRREISLNLLRDIPKIQPLSPQAGMFMLVDIRETGLSSQDFVDQLYQQQGVRVLSASAFGACAEGFVRISFALDEKELAEGLHRIGEFVASL